MLAAQTAEENRGRDIKILDVRELTTIFDYFVVVTGTQPPPVARDQRRDRPRVSSGAGDRRMGIEGYDESRWILLDYGDVVVHVFDDETRVYYGLEDLWRMPSGSPTSRDWPIRQASIAAT